MKQKTFTYQRSFKVISWGCRFDSLAELKYAVSIRKDFYFLISRIPIFYDPRTKLPTNYIRDNIRRYTPDFLIRHKVTGEAFLVEIKPRAFEGNEQLLLRREVAENYIRWKNYDWKFRIVFDDEIKLSAEQRENFHKHCKLIPKSAGKLQFQEMNDRYDETKQNVITGTPPNWLIRYVMFGAGIRTP